MENKIKVMIVDDNVSFATSLKNFLEMQTDIKIVGLVHDGNEVIKMVKETKPDVITLDCVLPNVDASGILKALRNISPDIRPNVIIVSGYAKDELINDCMKNGADYYMIKPIDFNILKERIETIFQYSKSPHVAITNTSNCKDTDITQHNIEVHVTNTLHSVGVPANIKGYGYLREAIVLSIRNQEYINAVTKMLYPKVATKFHSTPSRVERAIRHAIENACLRGNDEQIFKLFGYTMNNSKCKPTNSEFIALIADKLRLELNFA